MPNTNNWSSRINVVAIAISKLLSSADVRARLSALSFDWSAALFAGGVALTISGD
jgi:hypothetical protein